MTPTCLYTLLAGACVLLAVPNAMAWRTYHRPSHAQIRNRTLRHTPPPHRKTYKDILERSQKSSASALENEIWRQELGTALPAGYGTVNLALLSEDTKKHLVKKAEDNKKAEAARAEERKAIAAQPLQPKALEHLQQMSNQLAGMNRFLVNAQEIREELSPTDTQGQFLATRRMVVDRPNKLKVSSDGPSIQRDAWFDGKTFTLHDAEEEAYAQAKFSGSLDQLLERLYVEQNVSLPLTDLLYSKPYDILKEGLTSARYLGIGTIDNTRCHQIACASGPVEWQVWIQADGPPIPRRLMIVYRTQPGVPRYTARINELSAIQDLEEEAFRFEAPQGSNQTVFETLVAD